MTFLALPSRASISRRTLLRATAGAALLGSPLLAACGGGDRASGTTTFRAVLPGGGDTESLSTTSFRSDMDFVRALAILDPLVLEVDGGTELVLAESLEPDPDARGWTLRVRPDVTFHDGAAMGAQDVLYSLRRIVDPEQPGDGAPALADVDLEASRVVDDRTVRLELLRPIGDMAATLARSFAFVVRDGADDPETIVGTGPFRLESFEPGQSTRLRRFAEHWRPRGDGPFVERLDLLSVDDPAARVNALRDGQADFAFEVGATAARRIRGADDGALTIVTSRGGTGRASFAMNVGVAPFDDPAVRAAVRLGTDRQELVDKATLGFGTVANDLPAPGRPGYADELSQRRYDPDTARAMLREAGVAGSSVPMLSSAALLSASTPLFVEQMRRIGLTIEVEEIPGDAYYADLDKLLSAPLKLWGGPTSSVLVEMLNYTGAGFDGTQWAVPEFNRLVAGAKATLDDTERDELLDQAQRMLWDEGGEVIWGVSPNLHAVRGGVSGIELAAFGRYPSFLGAKVDRG